MLDPVSEEMNIKAAAAAEAVYRLSDPAYFDPGLKLELRKSAGEIISRVAGLRFFIVRGDRREEFIESLFAEIAGVSELIAFAEDMKLIAPDNGERVIAAYARIRDWASQKTSLGDSPSKLGGKEDSESALFGKYNFVSPDTAPKGPPEFMEKSPPEKENADNLYDEKLDGAATTSQWIGSEPNINSRQLKIVDFLKGRGQAQIGDIRVLFGDDVSEKTLQRDLWQMVSYGLISREGENRWTTYVYLGHSLGH